MTTTLTKSLLAGLLVWAMAGQVEADPDTLQNMTRAMNSSGIDISGRIEIEAAYQETETGDSSDITLATAELGIEAQPVRHLSGHIVLLFEEEDTEPMEIDQGYIRLDGADKNPFYVEAGRLYLPFGRFESHFISDPLTLELGETRETALVAGYAGDRLDVSIGAFNGDVNESGEEDDMIDGFTAAVAYAAPRQAGIGLSLGLSYLSNVGDSDGLADQLTNADTVTRYVPAIAANVSADWNEVLFATIEVVTATDTFSAGDVTFGGGREVQPRALNVEAAVAVNRLLQVGVRYGATDDAGDFLPETVYGGVVNFTPMDPLGFGIEYLKGVFEDGSESDTITVQLAIEF